MRPPRTSEVCIDSQIFLSSDSNSCTNVLAASSLLSAQPPTARQKAYASIRQHTLRTRCAHAAHTLRSIPAPPPSLSAQPPRGMPPRIRQQHTFIRQHTLRSIPASRSAQPPIEACRPAFHAHPPASAASEAQRVASVLSPATVCQHQHASAYVRIRQQHTYSSEAHAAYLSALSSDSAVAPNMHQYL
jgi:hypothetical protein